MLVQLTLRDFRNFAQLDVSVPETGLVIVGENGQGKTNLLEAVAFLSLLRSMRGARDADCIRFGAPAFHIRAEASPPAHFHRIALGYERATRRKRATLDGVEQPRLSAALGALPSVGFSPQDVSLIAGSPGERRRFLDITLALSSHEYLVSLQQYRAVLARRNAALRDIQHDMARARRGSTVSHASQVEQVAVWEPMLAEHGATVIALRMAFTQTHGPQFTTLAADIGETAPVAMRYQPALGATAVDVEWSSLTTAERTAHLSSLLMDLFEQQRSQELRRGTTLVGPHRDELQFLLGGRDLRTFGSAGQHRSAAIALRLLELSVLRDALGATPLLLLDDPFAELDLTRVGRVLGLLQEAHVGQVLLAVPREEDVPSVFTRLERRTMQAGQLT